MIGDLVKWECQKCKNVFWVKEADIGKCPKCDV
jgi:Zn finger protein HypA/HybF involved in hydrogenase expression